MNYLILIVIIYLKNKKISLYKISMGNFTSTNSNIDLEITTEKITNLEGEIEIFMENQKSNIIEIFNDPKFGSPKNIEYSIDANNNCHSNENEIKSLHDYVIQWSIHGSNYANSTKCNLTLFNIGSLLGANGLLYSISLFYYYFMKIPIDNNSTGESIKKDIEDCLTYIDNGNITNLNKKWNVQINDKHLNNLRLSKDFLINQFQEKITDDIFEKLNNNIIKKYRNVVKLKFVFLYYYLFFYN